MSLRGLLFMLKGILQTDKGLLKVINDYGCLFLCFAQASPRVFEGESGRTELNNIWRIAEGKGIISGDINGDGDYDDIGEAEVQNHDALASLFGLNVSYDGKHHGADEFIPDNVAFVFGRFVYKYGHFVVINKSKIVTFDSLGNSNTVRNGKLESMRWYYAS
jgi:hypothetical protein